MKTKQILLVLVGVLMMSCASFKPTSDKMAKIELGMTKDQTKKILGKGNSVSAVQTANGKIEKISYPNTDLEVQKPDYILVFKNDRLVEWYLDEKVKDRRKGHHQR